MGGPMLGHMKNRDMGDMPQRWMASLQASTPRRPGESSRQERLCEGRSRYGRTALETRVAVTPGCVDSAIRR